jgi:hypothetical protein
MPMCWTCVYEHAARVHESAGPGPLPTHSPVPANEAPEAAVKESLEDVPDSWEDLPSEVEPATAVQTQSPPYDADRQFCIDISSPQSFSVSEVPSSDTEEIGTDFQDTAISSLNDLDEGSSRAIEGADEHQPAEIKPMNKPGSLLVASALQQESQPQPVVEWAVPPYAGEDITAASPRVPCDHHRVEAAHEGGDTSVAHEAGKASGAEISEAASEAVNTGSEGSEDEHLASTENTSLQQEPSTTTAAVDAAELEEPPDDEVRCHQGPDDAIPGPCIMF